MVAIHVLIRYTGIVPPQSKHEYRSLFNVNDFRDLCRLIRAGGIPNFDLSDFPEEECELELLMEWMGAEWWL